ncbi:hypothetical protein L208DRAFT_1241730 [Tricholoma matsutake]|nr:hypothetical protein L208DRAFT_1241730 [Tricholoma matsutake 945]
MQWTVQYFIHHSQWWQSASESNNTLPGPLAYANCQCASWYELALRADKVFRLTNADYISPFLSVYSHFSLQSGPKVQLQRCAQEIIWYAESQFRQVLLEVDQANFVKQSWTQRILYAKVMYVMFWIGIGTSIGLMIDVPILLWSLADSLADVNYDHLPLGFHPSLSALLDDGVASDSPSHLVESYACDWWCHKTEPAPARIFGIDTLDECLDHYRQWVSTPVTVSTPIDSQSGQDAPSGQVDCQSCIDLCTLIHNMFDEACVMHGFLSTCESAADAEMNVNLRKAAGFHHLHELALLKEIQSKPSKLTPAPALGPAAAMAMAPATSSALKNICGPTG